MKTPELQTNQKQGNRKAYPPSAGGKYSDQIKPRQEFEDTFRFTKQLLNIKSPPKGRIPKRSDLLGTTAVARPLFGIPKQTELIGRVVSDKLPGDVSTSELKSVNTKPSVSAGASPLSKLELDLIKRKQKKNVSTSQSKKDVQYRSEKSSTQSKTKVNAPKPAISQPHTQAKPTKSSYSQPEAKVKMSNPSIIYFDILEPIKLGRNSSMQSVAGARSLNPLPYCNRTEEATLKAPLRNLPKASSTQLASTASVFVKPTSAHSETSKKPAKPIPGKSQALEKPTSARSESSVKSWKPNVAQSVASVKPSKATSARSEATIKVSKSSSIQSEVPIKPSKSSSVSTLDSIKPSKSASIQSEVSIKPTKSSPTQSLPSVKLINPLTSTSTMEETSVESSKASTTPEAMAKTPQAAPAPSRPESTDKPLSTPSQTSVELAKPESGELEGKDKSTTVSPTTQSEAEAAVSLVNESLIQFQMHLEQTVELTNVSTPQSEPVKSKDLPIQPETVESPLESTGRPDMDITSLNPETSGQQAETPSMPILEAITSNSDPDLKTASTPTLKISKAPTEAGAVPGNITKRPGRKAAIQPPSSQPSNENAENSKVDKQAVLKSIFVSRIFGTRRNTRSNTKLSPTLNMESEFGWKPVVLNSGKKRVTFQLDRDQEINMFETTRRTTLPYRVHQLWDCIQHTTAGTASLDIEKLVSIAAAIHKIPRDELNTDLQSAIKDGLIVAEVTKSKGVECEVYSLPDPAVVNRGDHDWYCFKCHLGGAVVQCEDCSRVFHMNCLDEERKPQQDLFICPPCHFIATKPSTEKVNIKQKQLNQLLLYICDRIMDWDVELLRKLDAKAWVTATNRPPKEAWRLNHFVYTPMDMSVICEKAKTGKYTSLEEFQVDCETLVHAIGCFFGSDLLKGVGIGAAFIRDVIHDINEIKLCHDCFRRSNEKDHPWWFCLPCATPHSVVWAKQAGYPFWPAKVMKQDGNKYDVRYFGGSYERGLVDSKNIMPIETSPAALKVRKTAAWTDAFEELQKFQDIAKDPSLVDKLPASRGGKSTPGKSATRRSAGKADDTVVAKKSRMSEPAKPVTPKPARPSLKGNATPASATAKTSKTPNTATSQSNGMSTLKKNVATPKPAAHGSGEPANAVAPAPALVLTVEPIINEFVSELKTSFARDYMASVANSASAVDEDGAPKVAENTVSSSCNESQAEKASEAAPPVKELGEAVQATVDKFSDAFTERYLSDISAVKRKQWCFNCEREAIYHCCWNTAYCSTSCQQLHWTKEHKRLCRRFKRDRHGNLLQNQSTTDDF